MMESGLVMNNQRRKRKDNAMNTHEYIRKADAFKLIREYMEKVPHSLLECLQMKVSNR